MQIFNNSISLFCIAALTALSILTVPPCLMKFKWQVGENKEKGNEDEKSNFVFTAVTSQNTKEKILYFLEYLVDIC